MCKQRFIGHQVSPGDGCLRMAPVADGCWKIGGIRVLICLRDKQSLAPVSCQLLHEPRLLAIRREVFVMLL